MIRIGYFADGPWGIQTLEKILANKSIHTCFVIPRYSNPDKKLIELAQRNDIPTKIIENVNSEDARNWIQKQKADLHVSMSFDQIIKNDLLHMTKLGFINCHAGMLPFYRGRNILNWALAFEESHVGVTVHHIDNGIDTGDIVRQDQVSIFQDDHYGTLLEKVTAQCSKTLYSAILDFKNGTQQRIPQKNIHTEGFYCGRRRKGDEWIDWNHKSKDIHNFIRSIHPPGPGAQTIYNDENIVILESSYNSQIPHHPGTPGEVTGRHDRGVLVKTGDSALLISKVANISPSGQIENIRTPRHRIGSRFGLNIIDEIVSLKKTIQKLKTELKEKNLY
ncbi:MAG: methionyl-tRNA formyltransferase [Oligoflexales bacterium]